MELSKIATAQLLIVLAVLASVSYDTRALQWAPWFPVGDRPPFGFIRRWNAERQRAETACPPNPALEDQPKEQEAKQLLCMTERLNVDYTQKKMVAFAKRLTKVKKYVKGAFNTAYDLCRKMMPMGLNKKQKDVFAFRCTFNQLPITSAKKDPKKRKCQKAKFLLSPSQFGCVPSALELWLLPILNACVAKVRKQQGGAVIRPRASEKRNCAGRWIGSRKVGECVLIRFNLIKNGEVDQAALAIDTAMFPGVKNVRKFCPQKKPDEFINCGVELAENKCVPVASGWVAENLQKQTRG